jgi:simple sugar transport system ATP-binding protein
MNKPDVVTTTASSTAAKAAGRAPLLLLEGLSKRFGSLQALSDISLDIRPGEVHCLLGENGAGKSTLCNLIFGVHRSDTGSMKLEGKLYRPSGPFDALSNGVAMVHQHFSLVPDLTVVDNLLLGQARGFLDRAACADRVRKLSDEYGLPLDPFARIEELSVGERQRVEIVKCLMREPKLLVLDEPTAVLLPEEIASLLEVCRSVADKGCGVVLVTHKLAEIKKIADRVTVLRGGRTVAHSDNPSGEIDALVRAMIHRDLGSMDSAAKSAIGIVSDEEETPHAVTRIRKTDAVQIDALTVRDDQGVTRLSEFTLTIKPGEIVGIAGVEGNGQSELAAALAGMRTPTSGRFFLGERELTGSAPKEISEAGVAFVPEDRHAVGCITAMSVADNIFLGRTKPFTRYGFLRRAALREAAVELMKRFDVRAQSPDIPMGSLSGGNQQKAVLARELTRDNLSFLIAAQPTRGLDVGAVEAVYGHITAACAEGVAVLLISSELDELLSVADRIVVMYRGRIMGTCAADAGERETIGAMMAGQAQS